MADREKALKLLADELDKILNDDALLAKYKEGTDREINGNNGYIYLYISVPRELRETAWKAIDDTNASFSEGDRYFYTLNVMYDNNPLHPSDTENPPEMWITVTDGKYTVDLPFEVTHTIWSIFERETEE